LLEYLFFAVHVGLIFVWIGLPGFYLASDIPVTDYRELSQL